MRNQEIQRIGNRIRSVRSRLNREKAKYGEIHDGRGDRYLLAILYLEIGDYEGLIRYYEWFYEAFPDDVGFPELHLSWIVAGLNEGIANVVSKHLVALEDVNCYLLPKILELEIDKSDKWEGMNISTEEHADYIIEGHGHLIEEETKVRLRELCTDVKYLEFRNRMISNMVKLNTAREVKQRRSIRKENDNLLLEWEQELLKNLDCKQ